LPQVSIATRLGLARGSGGHRGYSVGRAPAWRPPDFGLEGMRSGNDTTSLAWVLYQVFMNK